MNIGMVHGQPSLPERLSGHPRGRENGHQSLLHCIDVCNGEMCSTYLDNKTSRRPEDPEKRTATWWSSRRRCRVLQRAVRTPRTIISCNDADQVLSPYRQALMDVVAARRRRRGCCELRVGSKRAGARIFQPSGKYNMYDGPGGCAPWPSYWLPARR